MALILKLMRSLSGSQPAQLVQQRRYATEKPGKRQTSQTCTTGLSAKYSCVSSM